MIHDTSSAYDRLTTTRRQRSTTHAGCRVLVFVSTLARSDKKTASFQQHFAGDVNHNVFMSEISISLGHSCTDAIFKIQLCLNGNKTTLKSQRFSFIYIGCLSLKFLTFYEFTFSEESTKI